MTCAARPVNTPRTMDGTSPEPPSPACAPPVTVARPDLADADRGERPVTRGDCHGGERPCPLVTCKHNLAVYDVLALPDNATADDVAATLLAMRQTCALDVVDALPGGATLEEIGEAFDVTRERVRQVESKALAHVRALTKHRHKHLELYLPSVDDAIEPACAPPRAGGVRVAFAETQTSVPVPEAHRHLPLVGAVERASETFWCGKIVAAVRGSLCVARQAARHDNGRHATYPLCAGCAEGHALAARVAANPEVEPVAVEPTPDASTQKPTRRKALPETTPAPADAPRAHAPEETTVKTMKTEPASPTPEASHEAAAQPAAPHRCGKCGVHPIATVTEKTRPAETTWCISCRRISTMELNGSTSGKRGAAAVEGECPRPGCHEKPARMMPGTPKEFAKLCGEDRRQAQNAVAKQGLTPAKALATVCRAPRGQRYGAAKPDAEKAQTTTTPAEVQPAVPPIVEVGVVERPAPRPPVAPPLTLDEERARFEATMRGLSDAGRALEVAKKVGGVENLEAIVARALSLAS